jgi:peptidoglycan hydrolase-like protein with peptidoglycan-binding domain
MTRRDHPAPFMARAGLALASVAVLGGFAFYGTRDSGGSAAPAATTTESTDATSTVPPTTVAETPGVIDASLDGDLVGNEPSESSGDESGCTVTMGVTLRGGSTGKDVRCLQQALIAAGYLKSEVTGTYGPQTQAAVEALQIDRDLFVDGDAGRETAVSLGIWPRDDQFVVRTPIPAPGAVDLTGFALSSVASAGSDAPALPAKSGQGRRIVFERKSQRVWAVDAEGRILRSWLVSGSMYDNETAGTHKVYSRSEYTTAWNGKATLKYMVRWLKTDIGAIGFHQIPVRRSDKKVYQTEAELGQRLSGGCQRQAPLDAEFLWKFAKVGTKVVVL